MKTLNRWWTFAIVSLALVMTMLDNLVVITALPSIRRALGASVSGLEWTVNAYTLTFAKLMMIGETLGDRFGRKLLGGLGMGLCFAPLSESVMAAVSRSRQGQASGSYNAIRELGSVFGVAVLGAVFQHLATSPGTLMNGFHAATFVGAGIVLVGAAAGIFLPGRAVRKAETEAVPEGAIA